MRWPIQILSLNLMPRAEETNGQEWWAFRNLSISLTKTQVRNKRRQPSQQRIMNTVFSLALYTYFCNFSIRPVLFCLSCPEKINADAFRFYNLVTRIRQLSQNKSFWKHWLSWQMQERINHWPSWNFPAQEKFPCPTLTIDDVLTLWTWLSSFENLRVRQVFFFF